MAARTGSLRPLSPGAALSGVHILAPGLPLDQAKAEAPARYHCGDPLVAQPMEALNEVAAEGAQRRLLGHLTQPVPEKPFSARNHHWFGTILISSSTGRVMHVKLNARMHARLCGS